MDYNPFSPEVWENPYPYYAELRHHNPVYEVPGVGLWAISRYDDVYTVLRTPQVFSSAALASASLGDLSPWQPEAPPMISSDPPYHTRLRKLVNRAFTPRRVASLEAHIREMVQRLSAPLATQDEFDLVRDLAVPLPVMAIAELLGVPPERYPDFKRWVSDLVVATTAAFTPEAQERIRQSIAEWRAYFQDAIAGYHKKPGDNLLSDMVRAEEENQTLNDEEILSQAIIILIGGVETTTNLIGNAMLALFDHPEQMAMMRANLGLVPNLVEETLRYEPPVVGLLRQATQDITLSGTTLPTGAIVMFLLGSANHDERKFPDPERFDLMRNTEGHLGFGYGIHFCLGAQLARLEAKVTLETLLGQFPRLARTDAPIPRVQSPFVRGVQTLPLVVG